MTTASAPCPPSPGTTGHGSASYVEILKSSALIGGATAITVLVGIVRTKAMAVLLGPAGYGLMGVFSSIADVARSVAGVGIGSSGVRQIAEAAASGDAERIARTVFVLRRTTLLLALLAGLLMTALAAPIAVATFGDARHAAAVALLSLAVSLRLVADGQGALIQGLRRIADLARIGILGAVLGSVAGVALVWGLGAAGVVPALVAVSAASLVVSWWYSRRVLARPAALSRADMRREAGQLLRLGLAFMASGLLMMSAAFAVRLFVLRQAGLEAAGLYHAAWTLGGLYVGFVLQAMGADFYPRLVGAIGDTAHANRLVNEQALASLLLAGPGVLFTVTLASPVVALFYSHEFLAAVDLLRWLCLGMALRVITWPMGYIIVATNRRALFFGAELAWTVVNIGLSWLCLQAFGLTGCGIAFFGSYLFHGAMVYAIARHLTGFRWSSANLRVGAFFIGSIAVVFAAFLVLPPGLALAVGLAVTLASSVWSVRRLIRLVPPEQLPAALRRRLSRVRAVQAAQRARDPEDAA